MSGPIKVPVHTRIVETDFGDRCYWSTWSGCYEDLDGALADARKLVGKLRAAGIPAEIARTESRTPYPTEW